MTNYEKNEIAYLPPKYKPLTAWDYFWYSILFMIPLVGQICLIVFAVSDTNINRRSFARSYFCYYIILAIVIAVLMISGVGVVTLLSASAS